MNATKPRIENGKASGSQAGAWAALCKEWPVALQNDFKTWLDWCVQPFNAANHPPKVVVNGNRGAEMIHLTPRAGEEFSLDVSASTDPDRDRLRFDWFVYPEAGRYSGMVTLRDGDSAISTLAVPNDAQGKAIHIIVAVTDHGAPPLTRYRRIIIAARGPGPE